MAGKILIVEDEMIVATDLRILLERNRYSVTGIARSFEKAVELIREARPDMVLLDIFLTGTLTGIDLAKKLKEDNIAFIYLSANANEEVLAAAKTTEPYGFIVKPFRERDLLVTLEIARYRHENSVESTYRKEEKLQLQLEEIYSGFESYENKLLKTGIALQTYLPFDLLSAGFYHVGQHDLTSHSFLRTGFNEYQAIGLHELSTITGLSIDKIIAAAAAGQKDAAPAFYNEEAFERCCGQSPIKKLFADTFNLKSVLALPLHLTGKPVFSFYFFSRRPDAYTKHHTHLLNHFRYRVTTLIQKATENKTADNQPISLSGASKAPATGPAAFEKIIGNSHLLLNVFDQVSQVAPMDTSVLIQGESGTGKESIAVAIHQLSPRNKKLLVNINCATLPSTLIESELFGHEKGSFTGALERRIGKFEQADEGTVFLDEIGEMPMDLQVKLLRVLQEQEIERIGGKAPIKINVRIIAATNRNLEKEVAEGRFRLDLYYRLNVFPVTLPPLRERREDIPLLAAHFINHYNRKTGRKITGLSAKATQLLKNYAWPGNIRELQHLIERSVLLTKSSLIEEVAIPNTARQSTISAAEERQTKSIHENEREYILSVLKKSNGKIWGTGGAAELLKIPPTTLSSKMKKLGIKRDFID